MNSMIVAGAAGAAQQVAQSDTTKKVVNVLLIGAAGYIVYRIGKNVFDKMRKSDAQGRAGEDPHVRVAMGLRNALNPSGVSWMRSFDGTSLDKLYEYAGQITNLSATQSAYKDLYGGNLMDDLHSDLNNEEYQKFMTLATSNNNLMNLVNSGNSTQTAVKYAAPLELIVAKTDLNVRSSPDASYSGKIWEIFEGNKNIVRSVKKGDFIGYATGRQEFDVKNNVKFIEVGYHLTANSLPIMLRTAFSKFNGEVRQWVSSSATYVEKFTDKAKAIAAYPSLKDTLTYILPPTLNAGLKGLAGRLPTLISVGNAAILNDRMQVVANLPAGVLLGECVAGLRTTTGMELLKFRNIQGVERWIDRRAIRIITI